MESIKTKRFMKRILILILTICSFVSYGQILQDPSTTPSTARTNEAISGSYPTTGTDTYSVSPVGSFSYTYLTGKAVSITIPDTDVNTGSSTLNFDGLGAKNIQKWSSGSLVDVEAGDLIGTVRLRYDGTQFVMEGGAGSGGSLTLTDGNLTTANGTSVDQGGTQTGDIQEDYAGFNKRGTGDYLRFTQQDNTGGFGFPLWGRAIFGHDDATIADSIETVTHRGVTKINAEVIEHYIEDKSTGEIDLVQASGGQARLIHIDPSANQTQLGVQDNGFVVQVEGGGTGSDGDVIKKVAGVWTIAADVGGLTIDDLMESRTMTGADDLDQTDNFTIIYTDSGSPFNVTVDLLTAGSQVTVWNKGAGTVTLVAGSGVTLSSVPLETDEIAIIVYEPAATPSVRVSSGSGVTPSALTKTDDTNVTLTLGGSPSTSLLAATSLTLGWTGQLSASRGGTGLSSLGTGVATWLGTPSWTNFNSAITGTAPFMPLTGTGTLTGALNIAGTSSNTLKATFTSLGATQTNGAGMWLANTTAAAAGAQQRSPSLVFEGQGWKTNATAASQSVKFNMDALPVQGTANPTGTLVFGTSINGDPYSTLMTLGSAGSLTIFQASAGVNTNNISSNGSSLPLNLTYGINVLNTGLRLNGNAPSTIIAGSTGAINILNGNNFAPTSGTADFYGIRNNMVINQTGTSSGPVYGFDYNPTLTSVLGPHYFLYGTSGMVHFNGPLMPNGSAGTSGQYLRSAGSGSVPTWSSSLSATTLETTGDFKGNFTATTSDITLDATHFTIIVDASSAARTVTLPTALSANRRIYTIKKFDNTNNVTIDANGSETIDRVTTQTLTTQYSSITIQSDGTEWWILSNKN